MLLEVEDLHVAFAGPRGLAHAVRGVSFSVGREKLGIVGESGSGKSLTARAALGLLPPAARVRAGRLVFDGIDLAGLAPSAFTRLRGRRIGLVTQDPRHALNPVMRVGDQIAEVLRVHFGLKRGPAGERVRDLLDAVRIDDPERVARLYPHEVSGGMGQRVMIAMMLAADPDLLIADEPTSALDATVQTEVVALLDDLVRRRGMGLMFISHDLDLVASFCDRVLVFYAGRIVEECRAEDLVPERAAERHPYTRGLLACLPHLGDGGRDLAVLTREASWLS